MSYLLFLGEGSPKETETLAYTLLSLLQQNDEASLLEATNLVYRLTSKMSPRGAFRSTQVSGNYSVFEKVK